MLGINDTYRTIFLTQLILMIRYHKNKLNEKKLSGYLNFRIAGLSTVHT